MVTNFKDRQEIIDHILPYLAGAEVISIAEYPGIKFEWKNARYVIDMWGGCGLNEGGFLIGSEASMLMRSLVVDYFKTKDEQ